MNGAEALLRTLRAAGVEVCFANPGTTELDLVVALDAVEGIRPVLALFEGVATGAADGYARVTDRPAATLTHLGPGFANGIANLHNARRAHSPVVNLIGDHATWHAEADAPLSSDIESLARPVSGWLRTTRKSTELPADGADALRAARQGRVASLVIPQDCAWEDADGPLPEVEPWTRPSPDTKTVGAAAAVLREGASSMLYVGGRAMSGRGARAAARIAAATGCQLVAEMFSARAERGRGIPVLERLPYFPEQAAARLAGVRQLVLAGAVDPVAFFGYRGNVSRLAPEDCRRFDFAAPTDDVETGLEALADALDAQQVAVVDTPRPQAPSGGLDSGSMGEALAALLPEGAIVAEEPNTSGLGWAVSAAGAAPHVGLGLTGGAIGIGLPLAVGAAIGAPGRRVVALQADGSGMYTPQALWTMAREGLDVTVVVCANRGYKILQFELYRAGHGDMGPAAKGLTDLQEPTLDWTALSRSMGVEAVRAESAEEFTSALEAFLPTPGPNLIEAIL